MKTFKQFQEEIQQLDEVLPLVAAAGGLAMKGLAAYSAGSALNNLRKGKYKQAGLDALGVIPGGKIYKGVRALGGAKKLAQVGSATQSVVRHSTNNAFNKAYNKAFDTGANIVTAPFRGKSANANTNTNSNSNTNKRMSSKPKSQTSKRYDRAGNEYSRSGKLKLVSS